MEHFLPLAPFERTSKKAGVKRITKEALEELRDAVEEEAIRLGENAVKLARHANRRTVIGKDIKFILEVD